MADETKEVLLKITVDNSQAITAEKAMTDSITQNTSAQDENTEATEEGEKATEDYSAATGALTGQIDKMTGGMGTMTKSIFTQIKGWKSLKVAIASTGIGLIIITFAAIGTAVSRLDGPMKKFADLMGGFEVITGLLLDSFGNLGVAIFDAFSKPQESIEALWEGIKTNIVNRLKGFLDTWKFVGKAMADAWNLDWDSFKTNANAAGESIVQTLTGVDELGTKLKNTFDDVAGAIGAANKQGQQLSQMRRQQELLTVEVAAQNAERRNSIALLRLEARQDGENAMLSVENFTEAARLAGENVENIIQLELKRQELIRAEFAASSQNYKDQIERDNALLESKQRITDVTTQQIERELAITEAQRRVDAEEKAAIDFREAAWLKEEQFQNKQTEAELKGIEEIRNAEEKAAEEKKKEDDDALKREQLAKQAAIAGAFEVANLVASLGADGAKAQAIFQGAAAVANAWQAFIVTLADPFVPFWGKFAAGAAVLAAGLTAAVKVKTAYAAGQPQMGDGGWLPGWQSHAQGGININGEAGEFMVNKRSMANPVLSSIVERINDFGNRQVMALGGFVGGQAGTTSAISALPSQFGDIVNQQVAVLVTEDLDAVQSRVAVTEDRSTLTRNG